MKKYLLVSISILLISSSGAFSQEKPIRIGVKGGTAIGAGLSIEYVTRLLDGKLAVFADYTDFSSDAGVLKDVFSVDNSDLTLTQDYWEVGLNYYIFKEGRSLYVSASYGALNSDFLLENYQHNARNDGTGSKGYSVSSGLLKVGAKFGRWFYIQPEIGFMFKGFESSYDVTVSFGDDTTLVHKLSWPEPLSLGFVASLGLGIAF